MNEFLNTNQETVDKIMESLKRIPNTIADYKEIQDDIENTRFEEITSKITKELEVCKKIMVNMEEFNIKVDEDTLEMFFLSKGWVPKILHHREQCQVRLEECRPRFYAELKEQSKDIFRQLSNLRDDIANFANFHDLNNSYNYFTTAKDVQERLEILQKNGQDINESEKILNYETADFSAINTAMESFEKYYKLWDYVYEHWQLRNREWLTQRFDDLNEQEMHDTIKKGLKLLRHLEEQFKHNSNLLVN